MMKLKFFRLMEQQGDDGGDAGGGNLPSGGDAIGTGNDARVALLNSIGDQYDNIRAEDLADINDDGTTTQFVAPTLDEDEEAKAAREEAETEAARLAAEQAAAAETPPTTQMITRKINGKDVTLPLEEWLIRAQKVESADEYLQDAARQRKELLRTEQPPAPVVPQGPTKEELAATQLAEMRQLARAIQMGTEEEAVAALAKMQNMSRAPTLTVEDVGRVADERLKFNTALNWFSGEYKDLMGNPQLYNMVIEREAALVASGDRRPYAERYKAVGEEIRTWRDDLIASAKPAPTTPTVPVTSLDAKRAAKAATPKTPAAASAKAVPVQQEEEDESASSVIAAMAKARGGPQWARG
jgi:hypothetical protein